MAKREKAEKIAPSQRRRLHAAVPKQHRVTTSRNSGRLVSPEEIVWKRIGCPDGKTVWGHRRPIMRTRGVVEGEDDLHQLLWDVAVVAPWPPDISNRASYWFRATHICFIINNEKTSQQWIFRCQPPDQKLAQWVGLWMRFRCDRRNSGNEKWVTPKQDVLRK